MQQSTDHEPTTSGSSVDGLGVSGINGGAPDALDQLEHDDRGLESARLPSIEVFWPSPPSRRSSRSSSPVRALMPAEIPAADITLGAELGRGGAGTVHAADWFGQAVAVKLLTAHSGPKEELGSREVQTELLLREAAMLASLRHPSAGLFEVPRVPCPWCSVTTPSHAPLWLQLGGSRRGQHTHIAYMRLASYPGMWKGVPWVPRNAVISR